MYIRFNNTNDGSTIDLTMSNLIDLYSEIEVSGSIANIAEEYNVIIGCKPNAFKTLTDKIAEEYGLVLPSPSDTNFSMYDLKTGKKYLSNITKLEARVGRYYEDYNYDVRMNDNRLEDIIESDFTPAIMAEIAYMELGYVTPLLPDNLISVFNKIDTATTWRARLAALITAGEYTEYGFHWDLLQQESRKGNITVEGPMAGFFKAPVHV